MINQFVIAVMSRDRVGIVADVARRVSALQGDIADLRQSVLRGYFTMILLASFPPEIDGGRIERQLAEIAVQNEPPLKISVLPVTGDAASTEPPPPQSRCGRCRWLSGRRCWLAAVAVFCADHAINILDLATAVQDDQYTMILQVDLSRCSSLAAIQRRLHQFAEQHAMRIVLQHNDIFQSLHEIPMPR